MTPTTAELLAEVTAAFSAVAPSEDTPPRTYTGAEIREVLRWGGVRFKKHMSVLLANGGARLVTIRRYSIDGRLQTIVAYQFAAPAKKGKKVA